MGPPRVAAIVVLLLVAACGGGSPGADTSPSGSPGPSGPNTTAPGGSPTVVDTASTGSAATTVPAAPGSWSPPCRDTPAETSTARPAHDPAMDRFGPLGVAPVLDVVLPTVTDILPDGRLAEVTAVARSVDGGVLVGLSSGSIAEDDSAVLAVINDDGSTRWVRCLPGNAIDVQVLSPSHQPGTALAVVSHNAPFAIRWEQVALDTGRTTTGFANAARRAGIDPAALASARVLDHSSTTALLYGTNLLVRYDLVEETATLVPPAPVDTTTGFVDYRLGPDDDVVATSGAAVVAVYHGGRWRTDDASRLAARPIEVRFGPEIDPSQAALEGVDGLGSVVWRIPEITDPGVEGVEITTDGPITMTGVCVAPQPDTSCDRSELVGVDTATGAIRWRLPGNRAVVAAADGWALLTDGVFTSTDGGLTSAPGYVLVDDRTGSEVDDAQRWPAGTFLQGCCGEGDHLWVEQDGAVIFAAADGHLRVWYPVAASGPTRSVTLP